MKGDLDGALQLFEAMVAKGVKADTVMHLGRGCFSVSFFQSLDVSLIFLTANAHFDWKFFEVQYDDF